VRSALVLAAFACYNNLLEQSSFFTVRHLGTIARSDPGCIYSTFHGGGPGGGCDEKDRAFFNPEKYKVGADYRSPFIYHASNAILHFR
jgi:hypothetical protein